MISAVHSDKFRILYATSRELVKHNAASDARKYVLAQMDVLREMYDCASVVERAKIVVMLRQWLQVATTLRERGVTQEVTEFYGLNKKLDGDDNDRHLDTGSAVQSRLNDIYNTEQHDWCADIFEKYKSSVVTVIGKTRSECSSGTGFVIREDGYVLTNHHVVSDGASDTVFPELTMNCDGDKNRYSLKVVAFDKRSDVALCAFDVGSVGKKLNKIPLIADYADLRQGADVLVIGNAFSLGLAPFTGTVRFTHDDSGNLVYTAPSNPGDSGGPVLNRFGECVGINKSITTSIVRSGRRMQAQGLTNATPSDKIQALITKWIGKPN